jgi:2'-5' RNA ligase
MMVRAFVALELSPEIKEELRKAQESLKESGAHLAYVNPDIIHITVKFLGEVEARNLEKVIASLKTIRFSPFVVTAKTVTADNDKRPRTVWCTIEDEGKSGRLFAIVEEAMAALGFIRETRKFTPHATVARVKRPEPMLLPALAKIKTRSYGTCTIAGFKLKKSTLTPQGPIYEDLLAVTW